MKVDQFEPGLSTALCNDKIIPAFKTQVDGIGGHGGHGGHRFGAAQIEENQSDSRGIFNRFFHGGRPNDTRASVDVSASAVVFVVD